MEMISQNENKSPHVSQNSFEDASGDKDLFFNTQQYCKRHYLAYSPEWSMVFL